jgi:tetratricopeptide (TPR) repeat protein
MALNWSGIAVIPDELVSQVYVPAKKGTLQVEMVGAARRYDRLAYNIKGLESLLIELSAGHPVIVLQNLTFNWWPTWHYALVFGYDRESATVIMHSGKTQRYVVDWTVFVKTWERGEYWGLLVLPPGILPETASEISYLESVLGLEQVENWGAAAKAYKAATGRWPESLGAYMGEGNSLYALGDLTGAEKAYRMATLVAPGNGSAHNNLAHILAEQGHYDAALDSIAKAIKIGGDQILLYEQTQREINEKMKQFNK